MILVPALFAVFPTTHPATLFGINKGHRSGNGSRHDSTRSAADALVSATASRENQVLQLAGGCMAGSPA
jgi:hypothetical protein